MQHTVFLFTIAYGVSCPQIHNGDFQRENSYWSNFAVHLKMRVFEKVLLIDDRWLCVNGEAI